MVGMNSHLEQSVDQGTLDPNELWFGHYLRTTPTEIEDGFARVTIFFRVVRRIETLCQRFVKSRMCDYQVDCGGRATHLVEQVTYGAEFVCSIRRPVDWLLETKDSAEESICLAVKAHFNQASGLESSELDKTSCTVYSSLNSGQGVKSSFRKNWKWMSDIMRFQESNWRPLEIVLRHIPTQLQIRLLSDRMEDDRLEMRRSWHWIWNESSFLSNRTFLQHLPPFRAALLRFHDLLQPLWDRIQELHMFRSASPVAPDFVSADLESVRELLDNLMNWMTDRRFEIKTIHSLLGDNKLDIFELAEIEARPLSSHERRANVFILRVDYERDQLIEYIQKMTGDPSPAFERPVFPVVFSGVERLRMIEDALRLFTEDARWSTNENNSYQIGLVPASSRWDDGVIQNILFPAILFRCIGDSSKESAANRIRGRRIKIERED